MDLTPPVDPDTGLSYQVAAERWKAAYFDLRKQILEFMERLIVNPPK